MMKIVLAPDSYKGSLTSEAVCDAMEVGIRRVVPHATVVRVPMADGGEGTVQSLVAATGGTILQETVSGPLGERVEARYGLLGDGVTAVIEMAEASGLVLVPPELRNPLLTTTYGTGELIRAALNRGCRKFLIGLGGSATNDGGAGMMQALGVKFLDEAGQELSTGGGDLGRLQEIDLTGLDPRTRESQFRIACDVDNPLCGPTGASAVFGPQKGATPAMVERLDRHLAQFAAQIQAVTGKSVLHLPGAGAAGGMGASLVAFLQGELKRGVEIVIEATRLQEHVQGADLVFTGEGQCDAQTLRGKTPLGVAQVAKRAGVPVIVLAGSIGQGVEELYLHGVQSVFSILNRPMSLSEAQHHAPELIADATERIMRLKC